MQRTVFIHHHIFKNAGTSFNHALEQVFGEQFLEYDLPGGQVINSEMLKMFILMHPEVRAISGHHIALPTPQTEEFQTISSVLIRRPLSRIPSIYEFERKQRAQTDGAIMAKELDFKEFVLWRLETSPIVFCNYQTHYCSRTQLLNPRYGPTEADFERAMENLKAATVVGTVERYNEMLEVAQARLRKHFDNQDISLESVFLNTTSKGITPDEVIRQKLVEKLGEETVAKLEEMNQLDERLYQAANEILSDALSGVAQLSQVV
jgi:hypothetical protein